MWVYNKKSELHQWKQDINIRLNSIDFLDKVSAKGNFQSKIGKVTITIEFRMLEIVLVPHPICHTKKDRITAMYFSTPIAKSCSFSDWDLDQEFSSAPVVSMALSENICYGLYDHGETC